MQSPEISLAYEKGALLPTSTKASSDDSKEEKDSQYMSGSFSVPTGHNCPEYVDIQEEIETNLEEIDKESKFPLPKRNWALSDSEKSVEATHAKDKELFLLWRGNYAD